MRMVPIALAAACQLACPPLSPAASGGTDGISGRDSCAGDYDRSELDGGTEEVTRRNCSSFACTTVSSARKSVTEDSPAPSSLPQSADRVAGCAAGCTAAVDAR